MNWKIHELKTWPVYYGFILAQKKTFDVRKNDRGFEVGDILHLREWNPDSKHYTGRSIRFKITYIMRGPSFGIQEGHVVMGFDVRKTEPA